MALTGLTKTSASLSKQSKTSATLAGLKKSGAGWDYDQVDITYDMVTDAEGREILYDGVGHATTLTGLNKTNA